MELVRGRFITLEGGDGAGKTTQIKKLVESLEQRGIDVVSTREVGGCPAAEEIRELWLSKEQGYWDPLNEVFLIMAARREHLVQTILPALKKGAWVISDRYVDSTRVYQGIGLGLGVEKIDALYKHIAGDFWPDLTLYFDVPVEVGAQRLKERAGPDDRYQQEKSAFHQKLRDGFLDLAAREADRFVVIDAAQQEDAVASCVQAAVSRFL